MHRPIASRHEFHAAVRDAAAMLASHGCLQVWASDPDFADWPWSEPAVVEHLRQWALPHRTMHVVALHYDEIVRRHARWVAWRRQWPQTVQCRVPDAQDVEALPVLLLAPGLFTLRLSDRVRFRGSLSSDAGEAARARDGIDAIFQRGTDAFPATTLGL